MTLAEASAMTVYVCTACQGTARDDNRVERLKAEGKPGAVVFTTICHQHNPKTGYRRGVSTKPILARGTETLSKDRCHVCDHWCNFEMIQCDKCAAWCHYACEKVTHEIAERSDTWYCRRCLRKDKVTYAQDREDRVQPQKQLGNPHQGVRQSKRRFEPVGSDYTKKRARLVAKHAIKNAEDQRSDEKLHLDLAEEKKQLSLHLEDEEELFLDLKEEPWSWA